MYYRFPSLDGKTITLSNSYERKDASGTKADELILLLECDRVGAASARYRLGGIDEIKVCRGGKYRVAERSGNRLDLRIPDARISNVHATFHRRDGELFIQDTGSKNGVAVNGVRVERHVLEDGDIIECGRTFFRFRADVWRPYGEPDDIDCAQLGESAPGTLTFYQPLAAQLRTLGELAQTSVPILIQGPSGTGKELIAQAIHAQSRRRGAFVGINCGALPENILEGELFGARRGAFTGATEDRLGLIRASEGGTLFLDEIAELPQHSQPVLLRVLQQREVLPIGATRPVPVDLRLVSATHRDLGALVEQELFRTDLLGRISGFVVSLPALLHRLDDFGILVVALLRRHVAADQPLPTISMEAMRLMLRYAWPLNIRELEHCLRSALALSPTRIGLEHLPAALRELLPAKPEPSATAPRPLVSPQRRMTLEDQARRDDLLALLTENAGNVDEIRLTSHRP